MTFSSSPSSIRFFIYLSFPIPLIHPWLYMPVPSGPILGVFGLKFWPSGVFLFGSSLLATHSVGIYCLFLVLLLVSLPAFVPSMCSPPVFLQLRHPTFAAAQPRSLCLSIHRPLDCLVSAPLCYSVTDVFATFLQIQSLSASQLPLGKQTVNSSEMLSVSCTRVQQSPVFLTP